MSDPAGRPAATRTTATAPAPTATVGGAGGAGTVADPGAGAATGMAPGAGTGVAGGGGGPGAAGPDAHRAPLLVVESVSYTYTADVTGRPVEALRNVSLTVAPRSIFAIIGPSRSGKSTLLRLINRLQEVGQDGRMTGSIRFAGEDIHAADADPYRLRRQIGFVFDKPQALDLSIRDNVTFGPRLAGISNRAELDALVEETLRAAFLWDEVKDRLDLNAQRLSGGQKQRLAIARSLALRPRLLLLDEPCSALDPVSTTRIEEALVAMKGRTTSILVTNNTKQAARISDVTAFFLMGDLIESGPTLEIFRQPRDQRTDDYLAGRFG